jgi:demethylmenaquinone methyltransferase/2-methoxy-6-polyprenyl-1,4-benzoquinol methylase
VVARSAQALTDAIIGSDASIGMLTAGRRKHHVPLIQNVGERLPFRDASFDMITIGFALRHFADLDAVFAECARVLRPNGKLLILEITAPRTGAGRAALGAYMGGVVPAVASLLTWRREVGKMLRYYWATTRDCVRPDAIMSALRGAGFEDVKRDISLAIFSEYSARLPLPAASPAAGRSESAGTRAATSPDRPESR